MRVLVVLFALGIDLLFGELPNRFHPVAFMGRYIGALARRKPGGNISRFLFGAFIVVSGAALFGGGAALLFRFAEKAPEVLGVAAAAFLLKQTLAVRSLLAAGRGVENALRREDLPEARRLLSFHLVSRDTSNLTASEIAGAAVESLAENITDGVLSPIVYFVLFGLPGAWIFRFVNTCDSMIAYRDPEREYFGKFAAYADTALNFLPARTAGFALAAAAAVCGADGKNALKVMIRRHGSTQSRNAGWTMAAAAGALGVTLEKRDCYRLEGGAAEPTADTLARARKIVLLAIVLLVVILSLLAGGAYAIFS